MFDFGSGLCYTALSADREFPETASESGREIHEHCAEIEETAK